MITRGDNYTPVPLNVCGSSTFGRYPKISNEKTFNLFISDNFMVPYAGYQRVLFNIFGDGSLGSIGRGLHTSTKLGLMVAVVDNRVYLINIFFDQNNLMTFDESATQIGTLNTIVGQVYITENNKPQVVISDNVSVYFYDPTLTPSFQVATKDGTNPISFTPGYVSFHDTYILCAASNDNFYSPAANNTWRLGIIDPGTGKLIFPDNAANIGLIQTKPDNTKAVVRFPSKGNAILVMGEIVTEPWFDVGYQLFPYNRSNSYSIDYGCLNPATIAANDEMVVWLAQNEQSGPIIVYTTGGDFQKITTDGIDYLFSQLQNPSDSEAFLYRQDGHLFYHINFYTDNLSLFYDFNTQKFYHACDGNLNYFIANEVAFFNNQYYFLTKNDGYLYAFDTIFTTYNGSEIPRIRTCRNTRRPDQSYSIINDVGFTIEMGDNNPSTNGIENVVITNGGMNYTTATANLIGGNGLNAAISLNITGGVITSATITNPGFNYTYPPIIMITGDGSGATATCTLTSTSARVDLSMSYDGGETFGSDVPYILNPNGQRKNKLQWWNCGVANDNVCQFKFWGMGRFVCTDGILNLRQ
jgi:hypothetical protein